MKIISTVILRTGSKLFKIVFPHGLKNIIDLERYVEYSFVFRNIGLKTGNALDVGCYGFFPFVLASLGYRTYGMDIRPLPAKFLTKFPSFQFVLGDVRQTDFPTGFFDLIIAVSTIEHIGLSGRYGEEIEDLDGDKKAVKELARLLKKNGEMFITVPYGKDFKIEKPFHRIYDEETLRILVGDLKIAKEEYYVTDYGELWIPVPKSEARVHETKFRYNLALLKLKI